MNFVIANWGFISKGLLMSLRLALTILCLTTIVSVVFGVSATLPNRVLRGAVRAYVELFRSIPLIVNVYAVYFGAPLFGLDLSPFLSVVVSLTLWGSANGTEIVRAGIASVDVHQWKSAHALGLRPWQVYRYVIVPQSLKAILPAYTGMMTLLVQSTALGALIGVDEFLKVGQTIIERNTLMTGVSPAFTVYSVLLLVYFVSCSAISWFSRYLEYRLARSKPGRSNDAQARTVKNAA